MGLVWGFGSGRQTIWKKKKRQPKIFYLRNINLTHSGKDVHNVFGTQFLNLYQLRYKDLKLNIKRIFKMLKKSKKEKSSI